MKNILITGASGFVGQNLAHYLAELDFSVRPISMRNDSWKNQNFEAVNAIIHLAGKAHDMENISDTSDYFRVNTELTKQIFDVFLNSEINDFVYFSSVKAVADEVIDILDETFIPNPKTPYGESKYLAEQYILSKKVPEGKRVFIIRPCMIHGPGNKGNLNLLYSVVKKRIPYPLAAYDNQRSFLSIDNLNFLLFNILINKNVDSGIYNFADDGVLSTNEVVKIISKVLSSKSKLWNVPKGIITIIAKIGDTIKLPLNSEKLKKMTENYRVSNLKIKGALNIKNLPISIQEGLEITIQSFIKNK